MDWEWDAIHHDLCVLMFFADALWLRGTRAPPISSEGNGWLRVYLLVSLMSIGKSLTLNEWLINHPQSALYSYVYIVDGLATSLLGLRAAIEAAKNCVTHDAAWTMTKTVGGLAAFLIATFLLAGQMGVVPIANSTPGRFHALLGLIYLLSLAASGTILLLPMVGCDHWLRPRHIRSRTVIGILYWTALIRMLLMSIQKLDLYVWFTAAELTAKIFYWNRYERQSFRIDRHGGRKG